MSDDRIPIENQSKKPDPSLWVRCQALQSCLTSCVAAISDGRIGSGNPTWRPDREDRSGPLGLPSSAGAWAPPAVRRRQEESPARVARLAAQVLVPAWTGLSAPQVGV